MSDVATSPAYWARTLVVDGVLGLITCALNDDDERAISAAIQTEIGKVTVAILLRKPIDRQTWEDFKAEYLVQQCIERAREFGTNAVRLAAVDLRSRHLFDLASHLRRQRVWSDKTFGPGERTAGVLDHIRKELMEIEAAPGDTSEWIDVVILAFDGAMRNGATPDQLVDALIAKQERNESRVWPDWRTAPRHQAIEHDRSGEVTA